MTYYRLTLVLDHITLKQALCAGKHFIPADVIADPQGLCLCPTCIDPHVPHLTEIITTLIREAYERRYFTPPDWDTVPDTTCHHDGDGKGEERKPDDPATIIATATIIPIRPEPEPETDCIHDIWEDNQ